MSSANPLARPLALCALCCALLALPASAAADEPTDPGQPPVTDQEPPPPAPAPEPPALPAPAPTLPATPEQTDKPAPDAARHHRRHAHRHHRHRGRCRPTTVAAASAMPRAIPTIRLARAAVCLINQRRHAHGLRRLRLNPRLSEAARWHTRDMVRHHYFGHTSQSGHDVVYRLRRAGYLGRNFSWAVGENLAWGSGTFGTPRQIVRSWMHSAGHRENILSSRYREIGIGVIAAGPGHTGRPAATYTTTFGARG